MHIFSPSRAANRPLNKATVFPVLTFGSFYITIWLILLHQTEIFSKTRSSFSVYLKLFGSVRETLFQDRMDSFHRHWDQGGPGVYLWLLLHVISSTGGRLSVSQSSTGDRQAASREWNQAKRYRATELHGLLSGDVHDTPSHKLHIELFSPVP